MKISRRRSSGMCCKSSPNASSARSSSAFPFLTAATRSRRRRSIARLRAVMMIHARGVLGHSLRWPSAKRLFEGVLDGLLGQVKAAGRPGTPTARPASRRSRRSILAARCRPWFRPAVGPGTPELGRSRPPPTSRPDSGLPLQSPRRGWRHREGSSHQAALSSRRRVRLL